VRRGLFLLRATAPPPRRREAPGPRLAFSAPATPPCPPSRGTRAAGAPAPPLPAPPPGPPSPVAALSPTRLAQGSARVELLDGDFLGQFLQPHRQSRAAGSPAPLPPAPPPALSCWWRPPEAPRGSAPLAHPGATLFVAGSGTRQWTLEGPTSKLGEGEVRQVTRRLLPAPARRGLRGAQAAGFLGVSGVYACLTRYEGCD